MPQAEFNKIIEALSDQSRKVWSEAKNAPVNTKRNIIGSGDLLYGIAKAGEIKQLDSEQTKPKGSLFYDALTFIYGKDSNQVTDPLYLTKDLYSVFASANNERNRANYPYIEPVHLLRACLTESSEASDIFDSLYPKLPLNRRLLLSKLDLPVGILMPSFMYKDFPEEAI